MRALLLLSIVLVTVSANNNRAPPPRPILIPPPPGYPGNVRPAVIPIPNPAHANPVERPPIRPLWGDVANNTDALIAQIHGSGVSGFVIFSAAYKSGTNVHVKLNGPPREQYSLKIYSLPLKLGDICTSTSLGPLLYDVSFDYGMVSPSHESKFKSNLPLQGDKSVLGRTVVLQGLESGVRICSVILPAHHLELYEARLHHPVAGVAYLMNHRLGVAVGTEWMMHSDGQRKYAQYRWAIYNGPDDDNTPEKKVLHEKTQCSKLVSTNLILDNEQEDSPHLQVSTEMPVLKGKSHLTLRPVPAIASSKNMFLILFEEKGKKILACAPFIKIEKKVAVANFQHNEVMGHIRLTQPSPYEATRVDVDLTLHTKAYSYGIDVLPNIRRSKKEQSKCPNIKETIYNPFHVDPELVPDQAQGTTDQYATGDLSGKYGTLNGKTREYLTLYDFNLPLYGYFSVVGRAVVIYEPSGATLRCANLDLEYREMVTAYATFESPVQGQFIFRQDMHRPFDDTYIYIEVSKQEKGNSSKTYNHAWHIHQKPVKKDEKAKNDLRRSADECEDAGKHLNPFEVSTECIYQRDCTIFTPPRCELGDETGKLGPLDIPTYKKDSYTNSFTVGKYYFIDVDLPVALTGGILDRSVVIHEADFRMKKLACANIRKFTRSP